MWNSEGQKLSESAAKLKVRLVDIGALSYSKRYGLYCIGHSCLVDSHLRIWFWYKGVRLNHNTSLNLNLNKRIWAHPLLVASLPISSPPPIQLLLCKFLFPSPRTNEHRYRVDIGIELTGLVNFTILLRSPGVGENVAINTWIITKPVNPTTFPSSDTPQLLKRHSGFDFSKKRFHHCPTQKAAS